MRYDFLMPDFLSVRRRVALGVGLGLALVAQQASALLIVNQPWVRPAQRAHATEAYMNLTSTEGASVVGVVSDAAGVSIRGPGSSQRSLQRLALPAQSRVALAPGGYRFALSRLVRTLKLGDRVHLTLTIEAADGSRQDVDVNAEVRMHSPIEDEMRAHKHEH